MYLYLPFNHIPLFPDNLQFLSLKNLFNYSDIKGFGEFTKYIIIYGRVKWKREKGFRI